METIYKILSQTEWDEFQEQKAYQGSEKDRSDGYFHFSKKEQVSGVIQRYFADIKVIALKFSTTCFEDDLKWEDNGKGEQFPHVYRNQLKIEDVIEVIPGDKFNGH